MQIVTQTCTGKNATPYLWAVHMVAVRPVVAGPAHVADHLLCVQDITQGALPDGGRQKVAQEGSSA